jgi:hypothetical protein
MRESPIKFAMRLKVQKRALKHSSKSELGFPCIGIPWDVKSEFKT